jgi:lysosomal acid lipase/cholesteryl ester hydrolase
MVTYDLPAVIEYVLGHRGQKDLYYIGHSMGTTVFFVLNTFLPQYNAKFRLMTGMAPISYMAFSPSQIANFSANPRR